LREAKPNILNQSFFHPLDDVYVGSVARNETTQHPQPEFLSPIRRRLRRLSCSE
jgi:hypothetical protein